MKFNLYLLAQENWTPESKMWAPHIPRVPLTFTPNDLLILVVETVHFESFGLVSLAVDRPVWLPVTVYFDAWRSTFDSQVTVAGPSTCLVEVDCSPREQATKLTELESNQALESKWSNIKVNFNNDEWIVLNDLSDTFYCIEFCKNSRDFFSKWWVNVNVGRWTWSIETRQWQNCDMIVTPMWQPVKFFLNTFSHSPNTVRTVDFVWTCSIQFYWYWIWCLVT